MSYGYLANSPLVEQITFKQASTVWMTTTKQYDNLNRLTSVSSTHAGPLASSYSYLYNDANQRTRATLADGSFWLYGYDGLGQVTSGKRYWSDNVPVAGQQYEYGVNDLGDRNWTKEGGNSSGGGLRNRNYSLSNLSSGVLYYQETLNVVEVLGLAEAASTVTVNGQGTYRKGNYFQAAVSFDNSQGSVYGAVIVGGTAGMQSGKVYVPGAGGESFGYDTDGNLVSNARWDYTWDAENRLIRVENHEGAPAGSERWVKFDYDHLGRRISKKVYAGSVLQLTRKYIYDGWNVIAELDGNGDVVQSYLWGLDLSGTMQGAGGVGGLLAVKPGNDIARFVAMDGNGNVVGLVTGSAGPSVNGAYEYGPFGEPIRVTGTPGKANPFRWSTKFSDDETDLVYYGHRYYNPSTGRWLSRDPIGEQGGPNLYAFVGNDPVGTVDVLGLFRKQKDCSVDQLLSIIEAEQLGKAGSANSLKVFQEQFSPLTKLLVRNPRLNRRIASNADFRTKYITWYTDFARRLETSVNAFNSDSYDVECQCWCLGDKLAKSRPEVGDTTIYLCPPFFEKGARARADTLFHEITHIHAQTDDFKNGTTWPQNVKDAAWWESLATTDPVPWFSVELVNNPVFQ